MQHDSARASVRPCPTGNQELVDLSCSNPIEELLQERDGAPFGVLAKKERTLAFLSRGASHSWRPPPSTSRCPTCSLLVPCLQSVLLEERREASSLMRRSADKRCPFRTTADEAGPGA